MEDKATVQNEVNPNDPSLHNKGGDAYKEMGYCSQEDYERQERRKGSRYKNEDTTVINTGMEY